MNWREYPHLFTNGKFRVKDFDGNVYLISQYHYMAGMYGTCRKRGVYNKQMMFEKCTLIARKIEDMTDEELMSLTGFNSIQLQFRREGGDINEFVDESANTAKGLLYILSIGILPPQFEWENVIYIKSLEKQP